MKSIINFIHKRFKKPSDKSRVFLNSMIVNAATILDKAFFFIINIIVARYLSLGHFGEYATALAYATFFSAFTDLGINSALLRAVSLEKRFEREHFANTIIIKTVLSLIVYLVMISSLYLTNYNPDTVYLTLVFGIVRIGNVYLSSFYALFDAKERFYITSFFNTSFSLSFLSGTIIVVLLHGNYFHLAYVRAGIVFFYIIAIMIITFLNFSFRFNVDTLKSFIRQALPFSLASVYSGMYQNLNILILSLVHGTVYSGIFSNGYIFLTSLVFIPGNLNRVLLPYLYKYPYGKNRRKFQFAHDIYAKFYAVMAFYVFIVFFFFSREFILHLFGGKYSASVGVLRIIAFGVPFIFTVSGAMINALDLQRRMTRYQAIAAIFNLTAGAALIVFFGAGGAALSVVLTYLLLYIMIHRHLAAGGYIKYAATAATFVKLSAGVAAIYALYRFLLQDIFFLYSFLIVSALYALFVFFFLITRDDLRIVQETMGLKWKKGAFRDKILRRYPRRGSSDPPWA